MLRACFTRRLDIDPPQGYNPRPSHSGRVPYLLLLFPLFYLSYKRFLLILPLIGYRVPVSFRVTLSVVHVRVVFHLFVSHSFLDSFLSNLFLLIAIQLAFSPTLQSRPIRWYRCASITTSQLPSFLARGKGSTYPVQVELAACYQT